MVIARRDFRDEELLVPRAGLEESGIRVTIASSVRTESRGMLGAVVKPDILLQDAAAGDYDAVVFVGGTGAAEYWEDGVAHALARGAYAAGKVVAAICIAPVTLARAGVLTGRKATVWASEARQLTAAGAEYTGTVVERDGRVITASGPGGAGAFAAEIVKAVRG